MTHQISKFKQVTDKMGAGRFVEMADIQRNA